MLLFHGLLACRFYGHPLKLVAPVLALSRALVEKKTLRRKIVCLLICSLQGEGLCSIGACAKAFATPYLFLPCSTLKDNLGRDRPFQRATLACRKAMSFKKRLALPQFSCLVPLQRRAWGLSAPCACWWGQMQFPRRRSARLGMEEDGFT